MDPEHRVRQLLRLHDLVGRWLVHEVGDVADHVDLGQAELRGLRVVVVAPGDDLALAATLEGVEPVDGLDVLLVERLRELAHAVLGADEDRAAAEGPLVAQRLPELVQHAEVVADAVQLLGDLGALVVQLRERAYLWLGRRLPRSTGLRLLCAALLLLREGVLGQRRALGLVIGGRVFLCLVLGGLDDDVEALAGHLVGDRLDDAAAEVRPAPARLAVVDRQVADHEVEAALPPTERLVLHPVADAGERVHVVVEALIPVEVEDVLPRRRDGRLGLGIVPRVGLRGRGRVVVFAAGHGPEPIRRTGPPPCVPVGPTRSPRAPALAGPGSARPRRRRWRRSGTRRAA